MSTNHSPLRRSKSHTPPCKGGRGDFQRRSKSVTLIRPENETSPQTANQKSKIINSLSLIILLSLIAFAWGCGYRSRSDLLRHIDSVTVSPIANETVEYGLEDDLADAIRQEFSRHWGEGTDSVFTGAIKMYEILPISLDQNNQPEQYRLVMEMSFVFEDLKRNKVLQNEKNYEKIHDFYVVSDRGEPPETLKEAKQKLIEEAAEDIVSSIVEEW
jgi:hypothetical protein